MFTVSQGMKPDGVVSALRAQYASAVRNDKRRKWNGFYVHPHPDLLPRGEGIAAVRFWFYGGLSDQCRRRFLEKQRMIPPLLEERAGVHCR